MSNRVVAWVEEWADELLPSHWSYSWKMFWMGWLFAVLLWFAVVASYLLYS